MGANIPPNSPNQQPSAPSGGPLSGNTPPATPTPNSTGNLNLDIIDGTQVMAGGNLLSNYMDVIYHIRLSMVKYQHVKRIQTAGGSVVLGFNDSITIAMTGGADMPTAGNGDIVNVFQNSASGGAALLHEFPYYAISKLSLTNVMSPSAQDPMISDLTQAKMTLVQPYGFSLHTDLVYLANVHADYPDINPGRIVYKLDVWWSGFDHNTGAWTPRIPVAKLGGQTIDMITNYVIISAVEASPTHAGTQYEITMTPMSAFAHRPEVIIVDGINVPVPDNKFGTFCDVLGQRLTEAVKKASNDELKHKYKITCPKMLRDATFDLNNLSDITKMENGNPVIQGSKDMDIFNLIHNVMADLKVVQDLYLADGDANKNFTEPSVQFVIRMKVVYNEPRTDRINDYTEIEYEYIIEPFLQYKVIPPLKENYDDVVTTEAQRERLNRMLQMQMIIRSYDYFLTGENTEVIDFNFKYKSFYYVAMSNPPRNNPHQTPGLTGQPNTASPSQVAGAQQAQSNGGPAVTLARQFPPNPLLAGLQNKVGGGGGALVKNRTVTYQGQGLAPQSIGATAQATKERQIEYHNHMDYNLQMDMMQLQNLIVRGDPLWMINAYTAGNQGGLSFFKMPGDDNIFPRTARCIVVRALAPEQNTYMKPNGYGTRKEGTLLGGFYQVTRVTSEFADGRFTQNISGVKLTHLNYLEEVL